MPSTNSSSSMKQHLRGSENNGRFARRRPATYPNANTVESEGPHLVRAREEANPVQNGACFAAKRAKVQATRVWRPKHLFSSYEESSTGGAERDDELGNVLSNPTAHIQPAAEQYSLSNLQENVPSIRATACASQGNEIAPIASMSKARDSASDPASA